MKTSNKILLSAFLIGLFILVGVHIALYAKFKKGEYTMVSDDMWPTNMITYSLEGVKYVSIDNLENLVIRKSDSTKLRYDKPIEGDENMLSVTRKNDTLFLLGKSTGNDDGRWYRTTHLSLAGLLPLKISNTKIRMTTERSKSKVLPVPMDLVLDNSFMEVNIREENAMSFGSFKIDARNKSRIDFYNVTTDFLDVKLKDSFLEETRLTSDSIKLMTDMTSKFELSGKNLVKAKIVSHE